MVVWWWLAAAVAVTGLKDELVGGCMGWLLALAGPAWAVACWIQAELKAFSWCVSSLSGAQHAGTESCTRTAVMLVGMRLPCSHTMSPSTAIMRFTNCWCGSSGALH